MKWRGQVHARKPGALGLPSIERFYEVDAPNAMAAVNKVLDTAIADSTPMEHRLVVAVAYQDEHGEWKWTPTMGLADRWTKLPHSTEH